MNVQLIKEAAVCAALVIVCLAGAEGLSPQQVAGQTPNQHSLSLQSVTRPGLRNSFAAHPLSAPELHLVLTHLRHKTGLVQLRFDEAGFLTIEDRAQIVGGSAAARELVLAALDGKRCITLHSRNRSSDVIFARMAGAVHYAGQSGARNEARQIEIDFADFNHLRGHNKAMEAFDLGFAILHELAHAVLELPDPVSAVNAAGDCERHVNRIRRELGLPERQRYAATTHWRKGSISRPTVQVAKLVFAETRPARAPGSAARMKSLYITWDVQEVGNIRVLPLPPSGKEKISAGVVAP